MLEDPADTLAVAVHIPAEGSLAVEDTPAEEDSLAEEGSPAAGDSLHNDKISHPPHTT